MDSAADCFGLTTPETRREYELRCTNPEPHPPHTVGVATNATWRCPGQAEQWCEHLKRLDEVFGTAPQSPLHHDSGRCPLHPKQKEE